MSLQNKLKTYKLKQSLITLITEYNQKHVSIDYKNIVELNVRYFDLVKVKIYELYENSTSGVYEYSIDNIGEYPIYNLAKEIYEYEKQY